MMIYMPIGGVRTPLRKPDFRPGDRLIGAHVEHHVHAPHSVRFVTIYSTPGLADRCYRRLRWGDIAEILLDHPSYSTWYDIEWADPEERKPVQAGEIIEARFVSGGYDVPHIAFSRPFPTPRRNRRTQTAVVAARRAAKANPKPF